MRAQRARAASKWFCRTISRCARSTALAAERDLQLRRLNYRRDTLEDIFLKAMETQLTMAVYKRTYAAYDGALTPAWSRFLILPRYSFARLWQSQVPDHVLHGVLLLSAGLRRLHLPGEQPFAS